MKKIILTILLIANVQFLFASNVLVINSYHKGYEWSDNIIKGMEHILYSNTDINVNILYMDSKRIYSKEYYDNLKNLYKVQLKNRKYDLVIAVDRFAYDFILDNYSQFFKDEPILAVGIESYSKEKAKKYGVEKKVSALLEKRDLKANLEAIGKIMPSLKKLYIINDKSLNALHTEPLIKEVIKDYGNNYKIIYLTENNLEDLKKRFSKYEKDSAALFIRFYKNANGELNKNKSIGMFIKKAKIPVFITDSLFIKKGAIGGKIIDLNRFGETSGEMALDILYKPNYKHKIDISKDLYYIFDSQKLNEFSLSINSLLYECELVNKRLSFYDKNRGFIEFVFTISPLLVFLILGLLHNIYMRKQVEKELRQRIDFDKVLLNAIESPIFWQNSKGIIVDLNNTFCKLIKMNYDELYGKKLKDFEDNKNVSKVINVLEKYKENKDENYAVKDFDENSEKKVFLLKQKKFWDDKLKSEGLVTIFTDITREREIAKEKQKNKQFIIQQSKLAEIGEVFSSIAHQWKSPLVEITAIAQELFYTKSCKEIKEDDSFVSDIMSQVDYMTRTINDFQRFIMPSNTKVTFDIKETIDSMLEIINHNIKYNNIRINIVVEKSTNLVISGYKNEFMQSFLNIINNAKDELLNNDYKNRKIEIKIFNKDDKLVITIEDNAGGIDSQNMHKVFKPYFSTKKDGHGIGLYMTKMIIEDKMDGKIFVYNTKNGALFNITLGQEQ
ncbi:ABC transporter substrate binding protein [Arcobacter sp.]|uniref:sensor histidine kinase n=1 Tax=Arcobacter sp. TaxID=1872629 RepID=UPI003C75A6DF